METYKAHSLEQKDLLFSEIELGKFAAIVSDIDYTLVDFDKGHKVGIEALAKIFGVRFSQDVNQMFNLILEGHRMPESQPWVLRDKFDRLMDIMKKHHKQFVKSSGVKVWSRETWILIVAEENGVKIDQSLIEKGRNAYWDAVTQGSEFYADTKPFLKKITALDVPLILMTGSDSILRVKEDCSFEYDPVFSETYKKRRLAHLFPNYPIITGDPIDKPNPKYFEKVSQLIQQFGNFSKDKVLFIGDSERNDLEVPKNLGYSTLLIRR